MGKRKRKKKKKTKISNLFFLFFFFLFFVSSFFFFLIRLKINFFYFSLSVLSSINTNETIRGLQRSKLLNVCMNRLHQKQIVALAPALNTLFKPRHYEWCFRLMSVLSFDNDESNSDLITWNGFRNYCLSYEHRLAKQPRLPLKYKNDLLRIEHILIDGIWLRPSRYKSTMITPRYPKIIMCRGELISLDGT